MSAARPAFGKLATAGAAPAQPSLFDTAPPRSPVRPSRSGGEGSEPRARPVPTASPAPQGRVKMVNLRQRLLLSARTRAFALAVIFAAVTMVALTRIVWLGIDGPNGSSTLAATTLVPDRGEITDRRGEPLARDYPKAYSLWFNPEAMEDGGAPLVRSPQVIAARLKAVMPELDEAATIERLFAGKKTYLSRRILPEQANAVHAIGEAAIETPQEVERHYPQGRLAAHVLGRLKELEDVGLVGEFGMEKALNARLLDSELRATPAALSIDIRVQGALEDAMERGRLAARAIGAAGVVLDVDTGEVLALASLPDFNPNRISESDKFNVLNRVTNVPAELGSTFKPLTIAAAIDAGVVRDLTQSWNAKPVEIANRSFPDFDDKGERLNIPQALAYSSNTVTMRVADQLGGERLSRVLADLHMNAELPIELPSSAAPFWPDGKWSRLTTMTVGYGHGISVTPLHLASAYAAMVNGGLWRKPTLMKLEPGDIPAGKRVFKASTSSRMRQLLRMIAKFGTGRSADAQGYRVGGKTGSAEKLVNGRYVKTKLISSFAAAFPMDRPRYVVVVALDEPEATDFIGGRTAAFNAAPIVGELIPRIGPMLGVRPDNVRDVDISDLAHLVEAR